MDFFVKVKVMQVRVFLVLILKRTKCQLISMKIIILYDDCYESESDAHEIGDNDNDSSDDEEDDVESLISSQRR